VSERVEKKLKTKHNYNEEQHKKRKQPRKKTTDMHALQLMKLKPGLEAFYAILCGNGSRIDDKSNNNTIQFCVKYNIYLVNVRPN